MLCLVQFSVVIFSRQDFNDFNDHSISFEFYWFVEIRGASGTTVKSKMEHFMTKVNGFWLLTFALKSSILDFVEQFYYTTL